jgi:hypothetical protein
MSEASELRIRRGESRDTSGASISAVRFKGHNLERPPCVLMQVLPKNRLGWERWFEEGDEVSLAGEVWKVAGIQISATEADEVRLTLAGVEDWEYFLVGSSNLAQLESLGKVMRVRLGAGLEEGLVATPRTGWTRTRELWRILERGDTANAFAITENQARRYLTDWVRLRRIVQLPEGLSALGELHPSVEWEYFLLIDSRSDSAPDLLGSIVRHQPSMPFREGFVLREDGSWDSDSRLDEAWVRGEGDNSAIPVSPETAMSLMTVWHRVGRIQTLPSDVDLESANVPWLLAAGQEDGWQYFRLREKADGPQGLWSIARYRIEDSLRYGQKLVYPGRWVNTSELYAAFIAGSVSLEVELVRMSQVRTEVLDGIERGRFSSWPDGIAPTNNNEISEITNSPDEADVGQGRVTARKATLVFTQEQVDAAWRAQEKKEKERRRRLFGDKKPFAIPDADSDL